MNVKYCCDDEKVNGDYVEIEDKNQSLLLDSTKLTPEYLYQHISGDYILFKIELPQFKHPSDDKTILSLWILCKHSKYSITHLILAKVPRISAPNYHPPKTNWINLVSLSIDITGNFDSIITKILSNNTKRSRVIVLNPEGDRYGGWRGTTDDSLDTKDDIFDVNIRSAAIIDIRKYSGYHSYYKHLTLEGSEHICIPKLYGQVRGYNNQKRKVGQIRWHVMQPQYGLSSIETLYYPQIIEIMKRHSFILNCCLMRNGNWVIMCRINKNIKQHFRKKYPNLAREIASEKDDEFSFDDNGWINMVNEESDEQIENAVLCTFKAYDEIVELLMNWRSMIVSNWIRKCFIIGIPKEITMIIQQFVKIEIPLQTINTK